VFRSLEEIGKQSRALLEKKRTARFFDKGKDSQEVVNLVEQVRAAIVCYQVSVNLAVQTRVNAHWAALTTAVDIQPDSEINGKPPRKSRLRPYLDENPIPEGFV